MGWIELLRNSGFGRLGLTGGMKRLCGFGFNF